MVKKILLWTLIVVAAIVVLFVGVVAMQPSDFRITRSATMAAAPEAVFAQVNNFHNWEAWSPWAELDPEAAAIFEGPSEGEGAVFRWAGNSDVGEGSMTIVESRPSDLIRIELVFLKPFAGTSTTEFTFQPDDDQTVVTWTMSGKNNFMGKAIGLFIDCDKMVGGQFEEGLANMKRVVEKSP